METDYRLETADRETATPEYAARFGGLTGKWFLDVQTRILLNLLKDFPKARVLDVGGGHAQTAEPLVKSGFEVTVTGSDDSCRRRLDQRIDPVDFEYCTCDSLDLPFADRSFDVVLAFRLLPHTGRWQQLLSEMSRVADRCVIFDYPDRRSTNLMYGKLFGAKEKLEPGTRPFSCFSRGELRREMEENGYHHLRFRPEFFLPMMIHRKIGMRTVSATLEGVSRYTGLTALFGSPVIMRADRKP